MNRYLHILLLALVALPTYAQESIEMADQMRREGKIYVLVAIVLTILIGLLIFLVRIDQKVSKLEKDFPQNR